MRLLVLLFLVAGIGWWYFSGPRWDAMPAGMRVTTTPIQAPAQRPAWDYKQFRITPLASFSLDALVLDTSRYSDGRNGDLAPYDAVLGWRQMSDPAVLAQLDISQMTRRWFWHTKGPYWPVPREQIEHNAANMHLVPANDAVLQQIRALSAGDVVQLRGYLIQANMADGWSWASSTTREDTGDGSCELVWVESVLVKP